MDKLFKQAIISKSDMEKGPVLIEGLRLTRTSFRRQFSQAKISMDKIIANRLVHDLAGLNTTMGMIEMRYIISVQKKQLARAAMKTVNPSLRKIKRHIIKNKKNHAG